MKNRNNKKKSIKKKNVKFIKKCADNNGRGRL